MTVMSLSSETRLSATDVPIRPAPMISIFMNLKSAYLTGDRKLSSVEPVGNSMEFVISRRTTAFSGASGRSLGFVSSKFERAELLGLATAGVLYGA